MIFSKFYYYTSIAATQYILGIRYIACRLQRWAWSKANNLIFRCFQWEPIIIVVSRVPRLPTGPYRLIQTKCQKGHRPTSVFACIFKNFLVLFMFPDDFSSIKIMAKSGCFGMIQIHDLRILKVDLNLPTFWPYWHLKRSKFENETSENIAISLVGDMKRTFVIVQLVATLINIVYIQVVWVVRPGTDLAVLFAAGIHSSLIRGRNKDWFESDLSSKVACRISRTFYKRPKLHRHS